MDPVALAVSGTVLAATLLTAVSDTRRPHPAVVAVPAAVFLALVGAVGWPDAEQAVREMAPTVAFLVLILLLAHLAGREGLFVWMGAVTGRRSGRSAERLLAGVVLLAAVVTAVLSLDATAVLLLPVVVATATRMGVHARPHTWATGHLANSASLLLPVSNLTNLLAFAATGLTFLHFTVLMFGPWLAAVATEYLVLRWLFRADLATPADAEPTEIPPAPRFALAVVGLTVVAFPVASGLGVSPAWPALAGVAVLAGRRLAARSSTVAELVDAADLPFALFVFGLAVVVLAVRRSGLEDVLAAVLPAGDGLPALLAVAAVAAVLANLLNNLPATLALLPVAAGSGPGPALAVLIGVNIGPNLSYAGSLANLLWRRVLGDAAPSGARFNAVGLATVPLTLSLATVALWAALHV